MSFPLPPASPDDAPPRCPFCGAPEVELVALFGSQLLTQQYYCHVCHTPFERLKDAGDNPVPGSAERSTRLDSR